MNNKYNVSSTTNGKFLIVGLGFVTDIQKNATAFSKADAEAAQKCAASMGLVTKLVAINQSFAVNYIRVGDVNADGSISANRRNPSKRRFATKDEAVQHGSRFGERRAKANDEAGTAGHIGYWVSESNDPVNAAINWKTGLTNPV